MMTAKETANLLRLLARQAPHARTKRGRVTDVADFRAWLKELADEAEQFPAKKLPAAAPAPDRGNKRRRLVS